MKSDIKYLARFSVKCFKHFHDKINCCNYSKPENGKYSKIDQCEKKFGSQNEPFGEENWIYLFQNKRIWVRIQRSAFVE